MGVRCTPWRREESNGKTSIGLSWYKITIDFIPQGSQEVLIADLKNCIFRILNRGTNVVCNFVNKFLTPERIRSVVKDYSNVEKVKRYIFLIRGYENDRFLQSVGQAELVEYVCIS